MTLYAQFADAPKVAVVALSDWMQLGQYALIRRVHSHSEAATGQRAQT